MSERPAPRTHPVLIPLAMLGVFGLSLALAWGFTKARTAARHLTLTPARIGELELPLPDGWSVARQGPEGVVLSKPPRTLSVQRLQVGIPLPPPLIFTTVVNGIARSRGGALMTLQPLNTQQLHPDRGDGPAVMRYVGAIQSPDGSVSYHTIAGISPDRRRLWVVHLMTQAQHNDNRAQVTRDAELVDAMISGASVLSPSQGP